jgi:hypothetical protein
MLHPVFTKKREKETLKKVQNDKIENAAVVSEDLLCTL